MADKVIIRKQDRIDYVLNGVVSYYNLFPGISYKTRNKKRVKAKKVAMKLLREVADISLKEIGYSLGCGANCESWVKSGIDQINDQLDPNIYNNKELQGEYFNLLKHLGL